MYRLCFCFDDILTRFWNCCDDVVLLVFHLVCTSSIVLSVSGLCERKYGLNSEHRELYSKCILVGLMNMIDGMQFWTPIVFYRHKTVLVSPWLCCIDK